MKHGPNALIDENLPVVVIATRDHNSELSKVRYEKTIANLKEVKARSGKVIAIATEGDEEIKEPPTRYCTCRPLRRTVTDSGNCSHAAAAYHIAVRRGCDVDQPRNLASR
jgi:glucosamine--fructose-6-phosphate aminotransferase (isomerizing)